MNEAITHTLDAFAAGYAARVDLTWKESRHFASLKTLDGSNGPLLRVYLRRGPLKYDVAQWRCTRKPWPSTEYVWTLWVRRSDKVGLRALLFPILEHHGWTLDTDGVLRKVPAPPPKDPHAYYSAVAAQHEAEQSTRLRTDGQPFPTDDWKATPINVPWGRFPY